MIGNLCRLEIITANDNLISDIGAEGEPGDNAAATDHRAAAGNPVAAAADFHVPGNIFTNCTKLTSRRIFSNKYVSLFLKRAHFIIVYKYIFRNSNIYIITLSGNCWSQIAKSGRK